MNPLTFERIFTESVLPIWDYGKNDRMVLQELDTLLTQLQQASSTPVIIKLHQEVKLKKQDHFLN